MTEITRMGPQAAAEYICCGYDWILKKARMKEIPHYKIGARYFFTKEALDLWIKNQERQSLQDATESVMSGWQAQDSRGR